MKAAKINEEAAEESSDEEDEPETLMDKWNKLRWAIIIIFFLVDMGSEAALGPSILGMQEDVMARSTDCKKVGDCDSRLAKRNALSNTLHSLGCFLLAAPYGAMADVWGRKPLMLVAILSPILQIGCLAFFPGSLVPYFVMNAVTGVFPVGGQIINILIIDQTDPGNRLKVFSLLQMGATAVIVISSALGSALVDLWGTQFFLTCAIGTSFLEFLIMLFLLPETMVQDVEEGEGENSGEIIPSKPTKKRSKKRSKKNSRMRKKTVNDVVDVLFKAQNLDEDHRWERTFFWLYLLSQLPDACADSVIPYLMHKLYGYTPGEFGQLSVLGMCYNFFWLAVGIQVLRCLCPSEARIFQVVIGLACFGDTWMMMSFYHYGPFIATFFTAITGIIPLILKSAVSNVTAEHRQGKIIGFLSAVDQLCSIISQPIGGFLFTMGNKIGSQPFVWLLYLGALKVGTILMGSYVLLPESMPPNVQARALMSSGQSTMGDPLMGI